MLASGDLALHVGIGVVLASAVVAVLADRLVGANSSNQSS
jgi:hypothetical protein